MANRIELPYTTEYLEYYEKVINALSEEDCEELKHLRSLDARWFDDIIKEIETDMNCTFNKALWAQ